MTASLKIEYPAGAAGSGRAAEWRAGGGLVIASALGVAVSAIHLYSIGLFIAPLQQEFGWSRAQIMTGPTLVSVISVLLAPFAGMLIDRIGPRKFAVPGIVLYCAALALLSVAGSSMMSWWTVWLIMAIGSVSVKATAWMAAVSSRFTHSRGLALALVLCGSGICSALSPVAAKFAIDAFGWRGAYVALGAGCGIITIPMVVLFFREAPDYLASQKAKRDEDRQGPSGGVKLLTGRFIRLALSAVIMQTAITAMTIQFVPIVQSLRLSLASAVGIAGLIGIASIVGRIASGFLLDSINPRVVSVVSFLLPLISCAALLAGEQSIPLAIVAAIGLGLSLGSEVDSIAYLTVRYFGLRDYGLRFGSIAGLLSFGAGMGPLFAAFIRDETGSYTLAVILVAPLFVLAALLILSLGPLPAEEEKGPARRRRRRAGSGVRHDRQMTI